MKQCLETLSKQMPAANTHLSFSAAAAHTATDADVITDAEKHLHCLHCKTAPLSGHWVQQHPT